MTNSPRYGGEECILFLDNCTIHEARKIKDRIQYNIETHPFTFGEPGFIRKVSGELSDTTEIENNINPLLKLIQRADERLYKAETAGRNYLCSEYIQPVTNHSCQTFSSNNPQRAFPI